MTKRISALLLAVMMITGILAGCGSTESTVGREATASTSTEFGVQASETQQAAETVAPTPDKAVSAEEATEDPTEASNEDVASTTTVSGGKTLVVYYSAQGHTGEFAKVIAEELNADSLELIPQNDYSEDDLNYRDADSRVVAEYEDESLRDVKLVQNTVDNWEEYDTVYIGYPIWWGIAAWPVNDFVANNDFTGKTVIPFCSAYSSGMGRSGEILEQLAGTGDWQEGMRFQQDEDVESARAWAVSMK